MFTQRHLVARLAPRLLMVCSLFALFIAMPSQPALAASSGLIISEYFANPTGNDSPFEYVELVATQTIDFAVTPYSVVFTVDDPANAQGWIAGGLITYGFNINTGTVSAGDVVYVGGSSMKPTGKKLRTINTATSGGDRFGGARLQGVLGNGGLNADGMAVFAADIGTLTNTTVPVDALFFGQAIGAAAFANGTGGYELPFNDRYSGGKLNANSFRATDPGSTQIVVGTGTYDIATGTFTTPRTWAIGPATDGATGVTVVIPSNQATVITCPSALFAAPETAGSTTISASDPDGIVGAPQIISGAVAGITLTSATAATSPGGTASATLNLAANTAPGIYSVKIGVSNNDTPPEAVDCTLSVGFVETSAVIYLPTVTKP